MVQCGPVWSSMVISQIPNMVWLVSRFYIFILLHYYKARAFSIPMINTMRLCLVVIFNGDPVFVYARILGVLPQLFPQ